MQGKLRRPRRKIALVLSAILAAVAGLGILVPTIAQAAAGCRVAYTVTNQWPGGFSAGVAITNLGDRADGWELSWTFPSGQQVTHAWNATTAASGDAVTATNMNYNSVIETDATVAFGFNGTFSGANENPATFTLNGTECRGTVDEQPTGGTPGETGDPMEIVAAMDPGWNLGNTLDALGADETAWGNPAVTQEQIQAIRDQGYNSIRIPVTWRDRGTDGTPPYDIDPAYMDRVEQVVDWSLDAGLYVLLNVHHDSWTWMADMPANHDAVLAEFNAIWTQLADRYKDHPHELLLESVNEPQFNNVPESTEFELLHELNVSFHEIVRGSGGDNADRLLVLPTLHTSSEQARIDPLLATFDELDDPNLAATVHYYGFWPFSVNIAGFTRFDDQSRQWTEDNFDRVHDSFVQRGIPVIMGEWGLLGFDTHTGTVQQGEKLKFFEHVSHYAREKGITLQLWDNGQHFDRQTFEWKDQELYEIMKAGWTGRSGTASDDFVYIERGAAIEDAALTLNLNGTAFEGLRNGDTPLAEGSDYTVSGDTLTIRASLLTQVAGSTGHGVQADLFADFSEGAPWRISVIAYERPVLQNTSGSTDAFAIPTQFRGDQVATMEATYADGSNAGPADWTSYKEFGRAFDPKYDEGNIVLPKGFFDEIDERPVTLTFHFWSGETVTYTVTKSGATATGTAS
jgi:endoglucanase